MSAMNSKEAYSSVSPCSYHVFLSFNGNDTRKTFTDHLYSALTQAGFHTFRDDDGIGKGEDIKSELERAIRESRISIIVFSKNYASSTWCLEELVMALKRRTLGHIVLPVFYDVDPSEVRKQIGNVKEAFARHEEMVKSETNELAKEKLKEKLGTWRVALREVANLAGMNLKNQLDGHEASFIKKIIKVIRDKLSRTTMDTAPNLVGIHSRVKNIQLWLEDGQSNVDIVSICGMGGIGKTTIAKLLYNLNFLRFDGTSFLENVRETSQQKDGLLRLQRKFLSDILKTRKVKLNNIAEGTAMIKDAICCKKVFIVLDDVDKLNQLDALLGVRGWLFPGSKIIITTRREQLLRPYEYYKVYKLETLSDEESLELFSWHTFGKSCPSVGYGEVSKRAVSYCGGIPLAIKVLGSSLLGNCLNVWKSQLEKLKAIPDSQIVEILRISYDSLQDDHDKCLFLNLACFFVGRDSDSIVTILDGCEFYTVVGIQNLIDRCLISIDENNILVMHHLLQQMGKEIVRQESPKEPGKQSILWNHKDAFNILRENTGTSKIEGLKLDMCMLKDDTYACRISGGNRKRRYEEFLGKPLLSNLGGSLKRYGFGFFSSHLEHPDQENSNPLTLEADAFAKMNRLKLLQLNHVHISGPYGKFPRQLRWLCWRGFPLKTIPGDFPLESLVALDMQYSSLRNVWEGTKFLKLLKILNLSYSYDLVKFPKVSETPNLERLMLKSCTSLVEVHESIGSLERLVLLNLEDCKNLRNLPRSICMLKHLETLIISGCSNLNGLPMNIENMESLTTLKVDGIALNQSLPTNEGVNGIHFFFWPWWLKLKESSEILWPSLPRSLVKLSLAKCNLSDDDFPRELSNLRLLKELDLSHNQFRSLPDFIRGFTKLELLSVGSCPRLRKLDGIPQQSHLLFQANRLLEEVTLQVSHRPTTICHVDSCSHPKTMVLFKLESIENVEAEIVSNLGLSDLQSEGNLTLKLTSDWGMHRWTLPLQVCYESRITSAYIHSSKVPSSFNFKNLGSSIDFIVPSYLNLRIQGLNICSVYEHSGNPKPHEPHTVISNRTKDLAWSHSPRFFGTTEDGEDTMWLSYWKFGNQLEAGDEVSISVYGGEFVQVKEVGVRLLYKEVQEEMSSQSAYEDKVSNQVYQFGNILPGNFPARQPSTILYQLGFHPVDLNGKKNPSAEDRNEDEDNTVETKNSAAHAFNFRELAAATKNFRQECLLGEGGFGRVYRGTLQPSGQVVAVKQLDRNGMQGNKDFIVEVLVLSLLHHADLVSLVGYCADGDQRLLVYEYMPMGSVEDHLLGTSHDKKPLSWTARMKIASGVAQGLEYLHEKANPPVIYRDLKSSSILLDEEFNPKLSDYGLAKLGLGGNKTHISPRVMGSYGYCAPEYERMGELTLKSDVYSFGVVLLELITGRKAIDTTRPSEHQILVTWAKPFFKDPKKFPELADPNLESKFPVKSLNQAVGVAAMCLQDEPSVRPFMSDVVAALSFLTVAAPEEYAPPIPNQSSQEEISSASKKDHNHEEEKNSNKPEDKHGSDSDNSDSDKLSDGDEDEDDDPFGPTSSDSDDGGSVEHRQEQDNSEKSEAQVKKSVKWSSRCRSKGDSEGGSVHSIARHNSKTDSHVENPGQNLNPNVSLALDSDSHSKITKCGSEQSRKTESEDGSVGSSSSSDTSDDELEDGRSSKNSRSNGDMGPKYESYGSNLRQDSDVASRDGSIASGLRSTSNMNSQDESLFGSSSRRNSNADAFGVRSNSNVDSQDGSVGLSSRRNSNADAFGARSNSNVDSQYGSVSLSSRRNSNAESKDGSLCSDSSDDSDSRHNSNVGAEHENGLS